MTHLKKKIAVLERKVKVLKAEERREKHFRAGLEGRNFRQERRRAKA